jgi:hypothetical protein
VGAALSLRERLAGALFGERLSLPAGVPREALPPGVAVRRNRWIPALGGWLARLGGPAAAVALPGVILVHPRTRLSERLLRHEAEHVRQWKEVPLFPLRYALDIVLQGHAASRFEALARAAESATRTDPEKHA